MEKSAIQSNKRPDYPVIVFMAAIHVAALYSLQFFSWQNLAIAAVLWFVTGCLGITLGYHRLLTHRSFRVPKWLERIFATCGALAMQAGPILWVGHHRMHHAGSDTPKDPHNAGRGFWYSHILWLFEYDPDFDEPKVYKKFARDLQADPYYRLLDNQAVVLGMQVGLALLLLAIWGWSAVGWGIAIRMVFGYHATWLVNSAAHKWGYTNYDSGDLSRNTWWVALVAWGEGWHNNHHSYGNVCRAGHKWWEIDITYWVIWTLKKAGLASGIVPIPSQEKSFAGGSGALTATPAMKKK